MSHPRGSTPQGLRGSTADWVKLSEGEQRCWREEARAQQVGWRAAVVPTPCGAVLHMRLAAPECGRLHAATAPCSGPPSERTSLWCCESRVQRLLLAPAAGCLPAGKTGGGATRSAPAACGALAHAPAVQRADALQPAHVGGAEPAGEAGGANRACWRLCCDESGLPHAVCTSWHLGHGSYAKGRITRCHCCRLAALHMHHHLEILPRTT